MSYITNNQSQDQLILSAGAGITINNNSISTIQDISATSTPSFSQIVLSSAPVLANAVATKSYVDNAIANDTYTAGPNISFLLSTTPDTIIAVTNPPSFTQVTISTQPTEPNQVATLSTVQPSASTNCYTLTNYTPTGMNIVYDLGDQSSSVVWYTPNFINNFLISSSSMFCIEWVNTGRLAFSNGVNTDYYLFWDISLPEYLVLPINVNNGTAVGSAFTPTSVSNMVATCKATSGANFVLWNLSSSGNPGTAQCYSNSGMSAGINTIIFDYIGSKYTALLPE